MPSLGLRVQKSFKTLPCNETHAGAGSQTMCALHGRPRDPLGVVMPWWQAGGKRLWLLDQVDAVGGKGLGPSLAAALARGQAVKAVGPNP